MKNIVYQRNIMNLHSLFLAPGPCKAKRSPICVNLIKLKISNFKHDFSSIQEKPTKVKRKQKETRKDKEKQREVRSDKIGTKAQENKIGGKKRQEKARKDKKQKNSRGV